jgi:CRP/FNR family transcriptional regulator
MMDHFIAGLCFEVAAQASLQVELMVNSAEDRLDHFMLERATEHPSRRTVDPLPVLKQMEVAQLLSITPEHLSRLLHKKKQASMSTAHGIRRAPHRGPLNSSH